MTNNRAKALEALTEWKISRSTGNADLEHEKAKAMSKAVEEALSEPKWKSMDTWDENNQSIVLVSNGNGTWPCVYRDGLSGHGFYELGYRHASEGRINQPTHWMHLPDAPTGGES